MIRKARTDDMPGLMRIEAECFGPEKFNEETVRAFVVRDDTFVLVASREDEIVGSAMCLVSEATEEGRIASIAVLKEQRSTGVGSSLLEECEHEFQKQGLTKFSLEVDVSNEPAIAMYSSFGYNIIGVIPDFYGAGRDAYWMEKTVGLKKTRLSVRSA